MFRRETSMSIGILLLVSISGDAGSKAGKFERQDMPKKAGGLLTILSRGGGWAPIFWEQATNKLPDSRVSGQVRGWRGRWFGEGSQMEKNGLFQGGFSEEKGGKGTGFTGRISSKGAGKPGLSVND